MAKYFLRSIDAGLAYRQIVRKMTPEDVSRIDSKYSRPVGESNIGSLELNFNGNVPRPIGEVMKKYGFEILPENCQRTEMVEDNR